LQGSIVSDIPQVNHIILCVSDKKLRFWRWPANYISS